MTLCTTEPLVAVTAMFVAVALLLVSLPQPVMEPVMSPRAQRPSNRRTLIFLRTPKKPAIKVATEMPRADCRSQGKNGDDGFAQALDVGAWMVMAMVAPVEPGVTVAGEKLAVTPVGRPVALKVTADTNGLVGSAEAIWRGSVAYKPRVTVRVLAIGEVKVKSAEIATPVPESATVCVPAASTMVSVPVAAPAVVGEKKTEKIQV